MMKNKLFLMAFLALSSIKIMAQEPYLGEIRVTSFNFAPKGWALCNGQLLPINQNQALFSLLGTTYGGNGQTTFALPDLRGKVPIHVGNGFIQGQTGGEYSHTLTSAEMPTHTHAMEANSQTIVASNTTGTLNSPQSNYPAVNPTRGNEYAATPNAKAAPLALDQATVGVTGGSQPHNNQKPYLTVNYIIALQGIYPSQN